MVAGIGKSAKPSLYAIYRIISFFRMEFSISRQAGFQLVSYRVCGASRSYLARSPRAISPHALLEFIYLIPQVAIFNNWTRCGRFFSYPARFKHVTESSGQGTYSSPFEDAHKVVQHAVSSFALRCASLHPGTARAPVGIVNARHILRVAWISRPHPAGIRLVHRIPLAVRVQVLPSVVPDGIAREEPSRVAVVPAQAAEVEVRGERSVVAELPAVAEGVRVAA